MIDTPRVDPASERIENNLQEHFSAEAGRLERAAAAFEAGKAGLLRPDGSRKYGDAEHAEREAALLAEYDAVGAEVRATAEAAIEATRRGLATLDGASPLDRLSADEQQAAS